MAEKRLYAKLTLDFADSHKIAPLSDGAFRAYVRMVLWSRRMLTDGRIPGPMAAMFAKPRQLVELTTNDPDRPSLRKDGDDYWIHDFLEHQPSKEQIEQQQEQNRANGAKGGRPRKTETEPKRNPTGNRNGTQTEPKQNTESESQSEAETTTGYDTQSSPVPNREADTGSDGGESLDQLVARQAMTLYGVEYTKVRTAIAKACNRVPNPSDVLAIIAGVHERAHKPIKSPTGVVITSIRNDWAEWQQYLDVEGVA